MKEKPLLLTTMAMVIIVTISIANIINSNTAKSIGSNNENLSLPELRSKLDDIKKAIDEGSSFLSPAIILGFVGILVPTYLEFAKDLKEQRASNEKFRRYIRLLFIEIDDIRHAMQNEKKMNPSNEKGSIPYAKLFFSTYAFDGFTQSGLYYKLTVPEQNILQNLYMRIKRHNKVIEYLSQYYDLFFMYRKDDERQKEWSEAENKYRLYLEKLERDIDVLLHSADILRRRII